MINSVNRQSNGAKQSARILLSAAVVLTAMVVSSAALHAQTFDAGVFEESVRRAVDGRVKGYAFVIADRNGIRAKVSGGFAQAPGDGNVAMKTFIPSNIGSVSKVMTGIALLDLVQRRKVADLPVANQLNTPMRFYLPDKWVRTYTGRNLEQITLRNLLNHRSGLADEPGSGGSHGTKIARALSQGANASKIGKGSHDYNNNNYTLFLYIIPAIAYRDEVDAIERRNADLPLADYNRAAAAAYGALYEKYMREEFLPRTVQRINPTCRPAKDIANGRYAKEYGSRTDPRGTAVDPAFCRSQGSWSYSAQDLAQFARTFEFTNRYLSRATRDMLFDPARPNGRLVFNNVINDSRFRAEAGQQSFPRHGGTAPDGARAALVRLPFGYVGTAVTNSPEIGSAGLSRILLDAFFDATRSWPEYDIDRPGANLANFDLNRPDPALCRSRCDRNSRCRSWTYVKPGIQGASARCWLKTGVPRPVANRCCASGVKGVAYNVDRGGSNYKNFNLVRPDPALCRDRCSAENRCRAWTYVKPGVQGSQARCWLKTSVPRAKTSTCCASGVR